MLQTKYELFTGKWHKMLGGKYVGLVSLFIRLDIQAYKVMVKVLKWL